MTSHAALDDAARRLMAEIGPVWGRDIQRHRDLVLEAYRPALRRAPKTGVAVTRDIAYGPHPRQVLDCFVPTGAADAPVVLFVHGGAYVRGSKRDTDEVFDNVLYWFARQGFVGINVEYRLAPEARWPGAAADLDLAIGWARENAARHGGDPASLFVVGHSAGGTHVATHAYDPAAGFLGCGVKGIVLISARLRADVLPENPNAGGVRAYFGDDAALYDIRSPLSHAAESALPVMIAIAEFENPLLDLYGLELAQRIASVRRRSPRFLRLSGHNHTSIMAHFNTVEETLGREIVEFTRRLA